MNKPIISVIMPVYNAEKYLDETINSVMCQTYSNIELIIINDGSNDSSLDIIKKWANKDSRIVVIDKKNEGVGAARNEGLRKVKGDLIAFVDHDDLLNSNAYEIMLKDMVDNDADIVMCNSQSFNDTNEKIDISYHGYKSFSIDNKELVRRFLSYEKIFCSSVWSKLYKKELLKGHFFLENITLGDDYYFNGMIYPKIKSFYYDSQVLYKYRITDNSICRGFNKEHYADKYKVAKKLGEELNEYEFISGSELHNFEISTLYELLYDLAKESNDKKIVKEWGKELRSIYKKRTKNYPSDRIPFKDKIKINFLSHNPYLYVKLTNR